MAQKPPNPQYVSKPYKQITYPSQGIQIDVTFVSSCFLINEAQRLMFYQHTAID